VLGSDLAGVVERVGPRVTELETGEEVFGVTNDTFTGGYAEYATAQERCLCRKPNHVSDVEAAAVPVVGTTAWLMLFEKARVTPGHRVLVLGAGGSVGSLAVQLARDAGAQVFAVARGGDDRAFLQRLRSSSVLGADEPFPPADVVIDTVGGPMLTRGIDAAVPGGIVVSCVEPPNEAAIEARGVRGAFFIVQVRREVLSAIAERMDAGTLRIRVGEVLDLVQAAAAHEMHAGRPHRAGKIVLRVQGP
jgi:NADPH:quinone reductase-like Zn-dependent oxidoreductase